MTCDLWNNAKTLSGLIGQLVSVTGCSGQQIYKGVLISADPVSKSVVLVKKSDDEQLSLNENEHVLKSEEKTQSYHLQIIPWVDLKNVVVHEKPTATPSNVEELDPLNFRAKFLKSLHLNNNKNQQLDENHIDVQKRKSELKEYLLKHQLSVKEDINENLIVHDLVSIISPYMPVNCGGTNQIVLDRIKNLVTHFDSKIE